MTEIPSSFQYNPDYKPQFKENEFSGQVIVVTGASRGIGAATARRFAQLGARHMVLNSRNITYEDTVKTFGDLGIGGEDNGLKAIVIPGNIGNPEVRRQIVEAAMSAFGRIDVLVNNAGIRRDGLVTGMREEQWKEVFETNFFGQVFLTQEVMNKMMRQKPRGGSIIFTSSIAALGSPGQANYAASKAAINAFVRSVQLEGYERFGIRINSIMPGLVDTDMTADLNEKQRAGLLEMTHATRALKPEEVADYIVYLSSQEAKERNINGQIVPIIPII